MTLKKTTCLLGIVFTLLLLSCTSNNHKPLLSNNGNGLFLVSGAKTPLDEIVTASINNSNIRLKGYVVILGVPASAKVEKNIRNLFYKHEIMAVHILNFKNNQILKNTDVLTIENAEIIVLPDMKISSFPLFVTNEVLKKALQQAANKGALVSGIGQSSALIGKYYFQNKKTKPALQLHKNLMLDNLSLLNNNKSFIQNTTEKQGVVFVGLKAKSLLLFNSTKAVTLNNAGITLFYPDKKSKITTSGTVVSLKK